MPISEHVEKTSPSRHSTPGLRCGVHPSRPALATRNPPPRRERAVRELRQPTRTMARGLAREQSAAKNAAKGATKGNKEDMSAGQRAERDAKAMQEKAAAKAAQKAELAASGDAGAAQVAADEAKKAAQKAAARERQINSTQVAKQNLKAGVTAAPVRDVNQVVVGDGSKPAKDPNAPPKPKLTPEEKKKKMAAAAALAAGGGAPAKKKASKAAKEEDEEEAADAAGPADEPAGDAGAAAASSKGDAALADAMEAKCAVEEPPVPVRVVDPEVAARIALRAKEQKARQDAEAKAVAKKEKSEAHEKVRTDIKAGSIKGLSEKDWDLLASSALTGAED